MWIIVPTPIATAIQRWSSAASFWIPTGGIAISLAFFFWRLLTIGVIRRPHGLAHLELDIVIRVPLRRPVGFTGYHQLVFEAIELDSPGFFDAEVLPFWLFFDDAVVCLDGDGTSKVFLNSLAGFVACQDLTQR